MSSSPVVQKPLDSHTHKLLLKLIDLSLEEDVLTGDITTLSTISSTSTSTGRFLAKESGVLSGLNVADVVFHRIDPSLEVVWTAVDGTYVEKGTYFGTAHGSTAKLLVAERLVLNIMQRMSGIATFTYHMVKQMNTPHTKLLDTRKTAPGLRMLDKLAVTHGGALNHRIGLFDMILIKDNHITSSGSIASALAGVHKYLAAHKPTDVHGQPVQVEIETRTLDEVQQVIDILQQNKDKSAAEQIRVDRMLLDNMVRMTTDEQGQHVIDTTVLRQALLLIQQSGVKVDTEASGNVSIHSVREIAQTGVGYISCGALTHSVTALDISMKITEDK